jgi:hypothetical protein
MSNAKSIGGTFTELGFLWSRHHKEITIDETEWMERSRDFAKVLQQFHDFRQMQQQVPKLK